MNYAWVMSHISSVSPKAYDLMKRALDVFFGLIVGLAACVAYPFVAIAVKIEDKGPVFIRQQRTGKNGVPMHYYKFRSMQRNETGKWVAESSKGSNQVTRVGRFIRKTRIDELPQGLAVLKGDMSLIGPRSDIAGLGERLAKEIPYYSVRTIITPGLTGWAQINQDKPPQTIEENKIRMSYDLYYIKYRSLGLDVRIILRTFRTLLSRVGA
jgi:lipopolysaccharide/colanic/teichoic acid biosynthesis glycosyltransferase